MSSSSGAVPNVVFRLPDALPLLRARVTLRLLDTAPLPEAKGAMLRGAFGYAFQRICCPQPCWANASECVVGVLCPYRAVFETPHPPHIEQLHDLRDVPRPFVFEPPLDQRTAYRAGEALEFGLVLIGRGIEYMPYFLTSFEELGRAGLGRAHARARLERVEVLHHWQATGAVVYQDGRALPSGELPLYDATTIMRHAQRLPADLRLELLTPLRLKARGDILRVLDVPALVQAICWRLNALNVFHGGGVWSVDHHTLLEHAGAIVVEQAHIRWDDLLRTSTRAPKPTTMPQGGVVGSTVLRNVSPELRAVLVTGSLVHVGKACTFGHGGYLVEAEN